MHMHGHFHYAEAQGLLHSATIFLHVTVPKNLRKPRTRDSEHHVPNDKRISSAMLHSLVLLLLPVSSPFSDQLP